MATTSTRDKDVLKAVKVALGKIVRPWEVLCGLTDAGTVYVPDIYCKTPEAFQRHISDYMDAPTKAINKKTGEVVEVPWDDEELNEAIDRGKYIELQKKPKYTQE